MLCSKCCRVGERDRGIEEEGKAGRKGASLKDESRLKIELIIAQV